MIKRFIILLLLICVVISCYFIIINKHKEYKYIELNKQYINITIDNNNNKELLSKYRTVFNNDEIVGEIKIDNSDFSMLFAKGSDNEFYLTHLINKERNNLGASFLDYRCDIDNSKKVNVYGHNNGNIGVSFNYIMNYKNKEFYNNHRKIIIRSENKDYIYEIFSVQIVDSNYMHMRVNFNDDKEWFSYISNVLDNSLYKEEIDIKSINKVLTLQTCTNRVDWEFLLVNARLVE